MCAIAAGLGHGAEGQDVSYANIIASSRYQGIQFDGEPGAGGEAGVWALHAG